MNKFVNIIKAISRVIIRFCLIIYLKLLFRYKVEGLENIPKNRPCIICANHQSYFDGQLLIAISKRPIIFLGKKELWHNNPLYDFLIWAYDAIPVSRDKKDLTSIRKVLKCLKEGKIIGIFPEGTRNGIEKQESIKNGTAFFAIKSKVPVICCGISKIKAGKQVIVKFSKPLDLKDYTNTKSEEQLDNVTKLIMTKICELSDTDSKKLDNIIGVKDKNE